MTKLTKDSIVAAIRAYTAAHPKNRPPSIGSGFIDAAVSKELAGVDWQVVQSRLYRGEVEGLPRGTTLSSLKKSLGIVSRSGRASTGEIRVSEVVDSILEHIRRHKTRPRLDSRITTGPLADKMNWRSLAYLTVRGRGLVGLDAPVPLEDIISTALAVIEESGGDLGPGRDAGREIITLPRSFDAEDVRGAVIARLHRGQTGLVRETPPPDIDADALYQEWMLHWKTADIGPACANPDAVMIGFKVSELDRAFAAATVSGIKKHTNAPCSCTMDFAIASRAVAHDFKRPAPAPGRTPAPSPLAA